MKRFRRRRRPMIARALILSPPGIRASPVSPPTPVLSTWYRVVSPLFPHSVSRCRALPSGQKCNVMSEALLLTVRDCRQTGNASTESERMRDYGLARAISTPGDTHGLTHERSEAAGASQTNRVIRTKSAHRKEDRRASCAGGGPGGVVTVPSC